MPIQTPAECRFIPGEVAVVNRYFVAVEPLKIVKIKDTTTVETAAGAVLVNTRITNEVTSVYLKRRIHQTVQTTAGITGRVFNIVAVINLGRTERVEELSTSASKEAGEIADEATPIEYGFALLLIVLAAAVQTSGVVLPRRIIAERTAG